MIYRLLMYIYSQSTANGPLDLFTVPCKENQRNDPSCKQ